MGIALADYDRDGHIDIFVANDSMFEFLYHNRGNGTFEENGLFAATAVDGNGRTYAGMGAEFQDYNNDGLPDLFITNLANETESSNHWLTLDLVGHKSNRDAIGAEVKVVTSNGPQWLTVSPAGSYLSSSDKRAHFGLGTAAEAPVQIHWPSGVDQMLKNVKADQILKIDEPAAIKQRSAN